MINSKTNAFSNSQITRVLACVLAAMLVVTLTIHRVEAASGDLDTHFGIGGFVTADLDYDDQTTDIAIQPDGRIVLGIISRPFDSVGRSDFILMRYNADGTLDTSFGSGGIVRTNFLGYGGIVNSVKIDSQNRILAAGFIYKSSPPGGADRDFAMARYTPSGSLDSSFGLHGKFLRDSGAVDYIGEIAIQKDGKIVAAGSAGDDFAVFRLTSNGFQDMTFAGGSIVRTDFNNNQEDATSVVLQSDGRIVVGGFSQLHGTSGASTIADFALSRYNLNGTLDTTFGGDGKVTTRLSGYWDWLSDLLIQPSPFGEQIIAVGTKSWSFSYTPGSFTGADFAMVCYQSNGSLNPSFGDGGIALTDFSGGQDLWPCAVRQADGKIVIAGSTYNATFGYRFALARYNSDGTLDTSFGNGGKVVTTIADAAVGGLALTPQGGIIVAGEVFQADGTNDIALAKYLP